MTSYWNSLFAIYLWMTIYWNSLFALYLCFCQGNYAFSAQNYLREMDRICPNCIFCWSSDCIILSLEVPYKYFLKGRNDTASSGMVFLSLLAVMTHSIYIIISPLFDTSYIIISFVVRFLYFFYDFCHTSLHVGLVHLANCSSKSNHLQSHILELRCIPEALAYFVTPKAVDENSPLLQQLPHWAACSITHALEFLTPSYKGHPRVMAYVLRVLESYPPGRVTFFMPQLVQALRYDEGVGCLIYILMPNMFSPPPPFGCTSLYLIHL